MAVDAQPTVVRRSDSGGSAERGWRSAPNGCCGDGMIFIQEILVLMAPNTKTPGGNPPVADSRATMAAGIMGPIEVRLGRVRVRLPSQRWLPGPARARRRAARPSADRGDGGAAFRTWATRQREFQTAIEAREVSRSRT